MTCQNIFQTPLECSTEGILMKPFNTKLGFLNLICVTN